jgi:hypothetical protein
VSDASAVPAAIVDIVDDGLSDDEIAARAAAWLSDLRAAPTERSTETAVEALDRLYVSGEL